MSGPLTADVELPLGILSVWPVDGRRRARRRQTTICRRRAPDERRCRFCRAPLIFGTLQKNSPCTFLSIPLPLQQKRFEDFFRSYVSKKILLTKFVSVKQRNIFFRNFFLIPQILCDRFKFFHDPLAGRDPAVEKHWSKPLKLKPLKLKRSLLF